MLIFLLNGSGHLRDLVGDRRAPQALGAPQQNQTCWVLGLVHLTNSYVETRTPNVIVFRDGASKEQKLNEAIRVGP